MDFNYPALMVTAAFVTGFIWMLDSLIWAPKRRAAADVMHGEIGGEGRQNLIKKPALVEYSRSLFPIILLLLLVRSFLVEPYHIPTGSMMPTLLVGDSVLVNKFAYGVRLPVSNYKIMDVGKPKRGDVIVFRFPKNPSIDYVKRVVGLPGDKITYIDKQLIINDIPVRQDFSGTFIGVGSEVSMTGAKVKIEHLQGVDHEILIDQTRNALEGEFNVPEGQYFVMGDNRDNSNDSRYWGFVPKDNLVGKALIVWMNWDSTAAGADWSRVGRSASLASSNN